MILDQLIEKKDLKAYIKSRLEHLELERQAIPYTMKDEFRRASSMKSIIGRKRELNHILTNLDDVKGASKYEWRKVQHLKKKKAMILQEINSKRVGGDHGK